MSKLNAINANNDLISFLEKHQSISGKSDDDFLKHKELYTHGLGNVINILNSCINLNRTTLKEMINNGFDPETDNINLFFYKSLPIFGGGYKFDEEEILYLNKIAYTENEMGISPMLYLMINLGRGEINREPLFKFLIENMDYKKKFSNGLTICHYGAKYCQLQSKDLCLQKIMEMNASKAIENTYQDGASVNKRKTISL